MKQWTILSLLNWAEEYFKKYGIPEPKRSAELLLTHVLNYDSVLKLYLDFDRVLNKTELDRFKALLLRRLKREPVQYICGETSFYGYRLFLTSDVLIPRYETEFVVEKALPFINGEGKVIVDVGTGSGAIIIALAKQLGDKHRYIATDISCAALDVARKNIEYHQLNINLINSDLLTAFKKESVDIVISNPPYIKSSEISKLAPEVREYEPLKALDGGTDGLMFYKKIMAQAKIVLKTGGLLIFEIDDMVLIDNIDKSFEIVLLEKDYNSFPRVLILKKN